MRSINRAGTSRNFSHRRKNRVRIVQSSSVSVSYRTTKSLLAAISLLPPRAGVGEVGVGSSRGSSKASECAELKDGLEGTSTMDKSESSLPTSEKVSVVAAMVVARAAVGARVTGPTEGTEVLSGAAWGMMIKEEEEMAPSSSEELWGSPTVILTKHLDNFLRKIKRVRLTLPKASARSDYHFHHSASSS